MEYLFIKGYVIILLCLFRTHVLMDVLAPHNGGKRHADGPTEPLSLAFGSYSDPLHHRLYIPVVENM